MEKDDEYKDFVDGFVAQFRALNEMAVREYTPLVDDICSRIASQNEVERLLDYLLGFAGNDKILLLYRRVCRHYFHIYPDSIAWYIWNTARNTTARASSAQNTNICSTKMKKMTMKTNQTPTD